MGTKLDTEQLGVAATLMQRLAPPLGLTASEDELSTLQVLHDWTDRGPAQADLVYL